jgi:hypothetical protein
MGANAMRTQEENALTLAVLQSTTNRRDPLVGRILKIRPTSGSDALI